MIGMKQKNVTQYFLSMMQRKKMYSLLDDDTLLEMILEFFVKNTKEQKTFHIVVISSTCVTVLWWKRSDRTEESARKFWEEYLLYMNPSIPIPSLSFSDVYDVFGGHIYDLEQCYLCWVHPEQISIVKLALVRWKLFLVPKVLGSDGRTNRLSLWWNNFVRKYWVYYPREMVHEMNFIVYQPQCGGTLPLSCAITSAHYLKLVTDTLSELACGIRRVHC